MRKWNKTEGRPENSGEEGQARKRKTITTVLVGTLIFAVFDWIDKLI